MSIFASLLGVLTAAAFLVGPRAAALSDHLLQLLDHPGSFSLAAGPDATRLLSAVSMEVAAFLVPIVALLALSGLAAAFFQQTSNLRRGANPPAMVARVAGRRLEAHLRRVGPGRIRKSLFKFVAIGVVCVIMLNAQRDKVANALAVDPASLPGVILSLVMRLVSAVCTTIVVMVVGDIVWSRLRWRTDLRMTRQEVKDEIKQSEGDPLVKSRLRSLARDRARRRMIAAVPRATVVIANPTHYAVALKYDRGKGGAPSWSPRAPTWSPCASARSRAAFRADRRGQAARPRPLRSGRGRPMDPAGVLSRCRANPPPSLHAAVAARA